MKTRLICFLAGLALAPAAALAQWSDNFDSYPTGASTQGLGGWKGWDNSAAAAGPTSGAQALSAPNSMNVSGPVDAVHEYSGVNAGAWTYTAHQYIPTAFNGSSFFILLNKYADLGPYDWSVELQFVGATNTILDDFRPENPVNFVRGQWAEIRVEFDLTANTVSHFYNNQLISSGTWTTGGGSTLNLAAVDLYANNTSSIYYDNMSLVPAPASAALLGLGGLIAGRRRRA